MLRYQTITLGTMLLLRAAQAQTTPVFTTLWNFDGNDPNSGAAPLGSLVQGTDGNLYGTTSSGGANNGGTVFRITSTGSLTLLYDFVDLSGDGRSPYAGLVLHTNGALYGATFAGGQFRTGTIFRITQNDVYTNLFTFPLDGTQGLNPEAPLVQASNGLLYGTTYLGGTNQLGTVFSASPNGVVTVLHNFDGAGGQYPIAPLVQATNGALYGTADQGGDHASGTIFRITSAGAFKNLASFGSPDGAYPTGGLAQATNGAFYGTTFSGGNAAFGTVFKVTPQGTLTTLFDFDGLGDDGSNPFAGLIQATDGNFYGTTEGGGANLGGTIFKITPNGVLTYLWEFEKNAYPLAALLQDTDGNFYGTTSGGGLFGYGTVFSLNAGLGPFVKTLPLAAKTGTTVKILGTNLRGATAVSFNGIAAAIIQASPTLIVTAVPAGATTGPVRVTVPSRILTSNVPFQVLE